MPEMPRKAAQGGLPWGHGWAGPGGMGGRGLGVGPGLAARERRLGTGAARGATHSPHTVAHGGIAPIEPRHADDTP